VFCFTTKDTKERSKDEENGGRGGEKIEALGDWEIEGDLGMILKSFELLILNVELW